VYRVRKVWDTSVWAPGTAANGSNRQRGSA
jgi:hypothetical protein